MIFMEWGDIHFTVNSKFFIQKLYKLENTSMNILEKVPQDREVDIISNLKMTRAS